MKTDELFYELFRLKPRSLFHLTQLHLEGEYTFESITIKTTEKRVDGFFKRIDGAGPNIFLEIQGYPDPTIYWRSFREVSAYYEQTGSDVPFVIIVLFIDAKYDPGQWAFSCLPPHQFIRENLVNCLRAIWNNAGVLTVLKPLAVASKQECFEQISQWKTDIDALQLTEHHFHTLIRLLEYLILQRFPKMTRQEVESMLQLTPIEKTVVGQELIQRGRLEGMKEGMREGIKEGRKEGQKAGLKKGELIGEIRLAQRLLKHPITPTKSLAAKDLDELVALLRQLDAELTKGIGASL